jgi:glycine/D-amino acid oxidase-like deaminating enzyme
VAGGADVVVVGGGIIGCACAYELATAGARVVLAERSELAAGASGRNHGLVVSPLDPVLSPMAEATLQAYLRFTSSGPLPFGMDLEPIGYLVVAPDDPEEQEAARREAEAAQRCRVKVEALDSAGLRELEPALAERIVEGWLFADGRRLQPGLLTVAYTQAATMAGAEIRTNVPVRAFRVEGDTVRGVVTDDGDIAADTVVLAAGPWTPPLARSVGVSLPMTGARGWIVSVAPERLPIGRLVARAGWHAPPDADPAPPLTAGDLAGDTTPKGLIGTMLQPNADGTMLIGGSRQVAFTPEPSDDSVPRRLLAGAIDIVPTLSSAAVLGSWWGIRPMTPDGRPLIGRVRDGLVVATGHGSLGVILGGGTAQLVSSIVNGTEPPFFAASFEPERFA